MRTSLLFLLLCSILSSCTYLSEFGPVNFKSFENGNFVAPEDYNIIDIDTKNISRYNVEAPRAKGSHPPLDNTRVYSDKIRPHDQLSLLVLDSGASGVFNANGPTNFGPVEVPKSGKISFPYVGEFDASGKSLFSLQKEIQNKYKSVSGTAEVSLNRLARQPFKASVIGEVNVPGQHDIDRSGVSLSDLLAQSGGTTLKTFQSTFLLHRDGVTYLLSEGQVVKQRLLAQNHDTLEVTLKHDHSVTLMGAIRTPGNHTFPNRKSSLTDFLGSSSGLILENSNVKGVYVIRKSTGNKHDIFRFNLKEANGLILASKFFIHGDDIIYVSEAPLSRFNRAFRNILPIASQAAGAAVTGSTLAR